MSSWGARMGWETPRCTPTSIRRTLQGSPSMMRCGSCWAASVCLVRFMSVGLHVGLGLQFSCIALPTQVLEVGGTSCRGLHSGIVEPQRVQQGTGHMHSN